MVTNRVKLHVFEISFPLECQTGGLDFYFHLLGSAFERALGVLD